MGNSVGQDPNSLASLARILDDSPETDAAKLRPSLLDLADRLSELIPHLPPSSPLLISGDWGSGKTSLLHRIRARVEAKHPTVWFEAWRYEDEGALLVPLIRSIWNSSPESYRQHEQGKANLGSLLGAVASLSLRGLPMALELAGIPLVAKVFEKLTLDSVNKEQKVLDEMQVRKEPPESATDRVWRDFHALVNDAWSRKRKKPLPLIIFIDDLDRCHPEGALDLLDAIRGLLTSAERIEEEVRVRFVVALDKGVLSRAVERKLRTTHPQEGNRFLEKMFPLAFDLPRLSERDVHQLVGQLLEPLESSNGQDYGLGSRRSSPAAREYRDALSHTLNDPNFANPRLMKRCIHRFFLVISFERHSPDRASGEENRDVRASFEGQSPDRVPDGEDRDSLARRDRFLAKWIAASEKWPSLRRRFNSEEEGYWHGLRADLGGAKSPEDTLRDFEALPGLPRWIQEELLANAEQVRHYRKAEDRLRRWGL